MQMLTVVGLKYTTANDSYRICFNVNFIEFKFYLVMNQKYIRQGNNKKTMIFFK